MKVLYCAYSIIDQLEPPDWIQKLRQNPTVKRERWALYDPARGLHDVQPALASALADDTRVPRDVAAAHTALRLDPRLFAPLADVKDQLFSPVVSSAPELSFRHLYCLLRADVVVLDLNVPSHGGKYHEALYGYLFGLPIIGIAHRYIFSPWVTERCSALVFPRNTDEIVRQVLAFGRHADLMIEEHDGVESADSVS